jgi:hypothetical protein
MSKNKVNTPTLWHYLISSPFIYGMIVPAVIWNIYLEIYHQVCFRLYGIPLVKMEDYFVYDRQLLSVLNKWEKINCYYCSYVNNLLQYSVEIAGRTERYWCPLKYERRMNKNHDYYDQFLDREKIENFREEWVKLRDFSEIEK